VPLRPGLVDRGQIERLVKAVDAPVNALAMRAGPPVPGLAALGVRRVSTGGGLARVAYGALIAAARELQTTGTYTYLDDAVTGSDLEAALAAGRRSG
jgi:2-methylisocitrate lyase-like PEP mutase family enzyme